MTSVGLRAISCRIFAPGVRNETRPRVHSLGDEISDGRAKGFEKGGKETLGFEPGSAILGGFKELNLWLLLTLLLDLTAGLERSQ